MIAETFSVGHSALHRLDPRVKVVAAVLFSVVVALASEFSALAAALIVAGLLIAAARLDAGSVAKRLALVNGFVAFLWLVLPFTVPGDPAGHIGPLTVTREGLLVSAQITIKSNAILMTLIALIATSSIATLGHALNRLRMPGKLVYLLLITYRYIFVLEQEYQRLRRAIRVRGFVPGTRLHTYRTYAYLIGMLFVRAAARAERVYQAMICRGFHGKFYSLATFTLTRSDAIWAGGIGTVIVAIGVLEWVRPI